MHSPQLRPQQYCSARCSIQVLFQPTLRGRRGKVVAEDELHAELAALVRRASCRCKRYTPCWNVLSWVHAKQPPTQPLLRCIAIIGFVD